jgi:hypothetical protein
MGSILSVLESEQREAWLRSVTTAMQLVHPLDAKEVLELMSLAAERKLLKETALALVKDEIEAKVQQGQLEAKREGVREGLRTTARQMKQDGQPTALIAKYTGLSSAEIDLL